MMVSKSYFCHSAVPQNLLESDHKFLSEVCTAVLQYNAYESTGLMHNVASCLPTNHILQN